MDPLTIAGPDALNASAGFIDIIIENAWLIGFIIATLLEALASRGNKAIAAVNEIRKGQDIPPETAKLMAVKLFKKYLPFIPDIVADAVIQFLFNKMKAITTNAKP